MEILRSTSPHDDRPSRIVTIGAALVAGACGAVFAVGVVSGASLYVYGSALALGLFALAFSLRRVAVSTYPHVEGVEERHSQEVWEEPIAEVQPVARRNLLRRTLWVSAGVFLASLLAPVASLRPGTGAQPGAGPHQDTHWATGIRLVDERGNRLRPEDLPTGGFVTVFPEGAGRDEYAQALLVRLPAGRAEAPTDLDGAVEGELVAYSKLCTHMGCPVGMYRTDDSVLYCPCHQASFDAARGARPVFGPATRPLPQLPIDVDDQGFLIALGDFDAEVGAPRGAAR